MSVSEHTCLSVSLCSTWLSCQVNAVNTPTESVSSFSVSLFFLIYIYIFGLYGLIDRAADGTQQTG